MLAYTQPPTTISVKVEDTAITHNTIQESKNY